MADNQDPTIQSETGQDKRKAKQIEPQWISLTLVFYREPTPTILFPEDGKRPYVDKYGASYKYRPGDQVCISGTGEGPYYISEPQNGKYTLCDAGGQAAKGGKEFEESELKLYDPFGN
ncbi:hypothetical protein Daus18300_009042 [Diaporthe australafricana]|uniref:Uncharacterized protein n=1 Tax=Diaporthe australafricana TaxID=127596 RepID=A0ABR3WGH9_9PEZI